MVFLIIFVELLSNTNVVQPDVVFNTSLWNCFAPYSPVLRTNSLSLKFNLEALPIKEKEYLNLLLLKMGI